jgi:hypothetical protein
MVGPSLIVTTMGKDLIEIIKATKKNISGQKSASFLHDKIVKKYTRFIAQFNMQIVDVIFV